MINELNDLLANLNLDKKSRVCKYGSCTKRCCYGFEGGKELVCKEHKINDIMIITQFKRCIINECGVQASYNYLNETDVIYCNKHKLTDMVNISRKMCKYNDCDKLPSYNYINKSPLYCSSHKLINMINVKCKHCLHDDCNVRPYFNYSNQKKGIYCNTHKLDDMIDVVSKKCKYESCVKYPLFALLNETAIYCGDHKEEGMINVKSKRCLHEDCDVRPGFNCKDIKQPIYCNEHKLEGMVDVVSKKCKFDNCGKTPKYNFSDQTGGLYCKTHKFDDMIDVLSKKCKTHLCNTRIENKYKGYCLRCFIYNFPESELIRNYGTKESKIVEFIKKNFKELNITYNKQTGGCSNRRPDILIDCLTHVIIVEVDENQHKVNGYTPECDKTRINELFTDFADRPIVFIRFNPDGYKINNKKYPSCFEYTEDKGLIKADIKILTPRLTKLQDEINDNLINIPNELITTKYLYYDQ